MTRYRQEEAIDGDWSRWIQPVQGYKMSCCDCGLVHDIEWNVLKVTERAPNGRNFSAETLPWDEYRVEMRVRRNNRATGQMRRKKKV